MKLLLIQLPKENQAMLTQLLDLLFQVANRSSENKMTALNLATVFGPLLLRSEELFDIAGAPYVTIVLEHMIKNAHVYSLKT